MNSRTLLFNCSAMLLSLLPALCKAEDCSARNILPPPGVTSVQSVQQNWDHTAASKFYNTSQGSQMMPYEWLVKLKQAGSTTAFLDAGHVREMGYIPRKPDAENPDGLPVGFARSEDKRGKAYAGLTCAACHTGQLQVGPVLWIIDGGQAQADAHRLMADLEAALRATVKEPARLDTFSQDVLGPEADEAQKDKLLVELAELIERRAAYNRRNFPAQLEAGGGPGRLDAFNAIFNEVAVRFAQVPDAPTRCDAPTSYPFLWDTPHHDRVQWNGSAVNKVVGGLDIGALGRNVGEVIGVFADVDTTKETPPLKGYRSSADLLNLIALENSLRNLWSPQWRDISGAPDPDLVENGRVLFHKFCATCHEPDFDRTSPDRRITAMMSNVGTDPGMATSAATRRTASGVFNDRFWLDNLIPKKLDTEEPIAHLLQHMGQRVLAGGDISMLAGREGEFSYSFTGEVKHAGEKLSGELVGFFKEKGIFKARIKAVIDKSKGKLAGLAGQTITFNPEYKARPLNGVWATAPYLHNGSVLNLNELLKPAVARLARFKTGTLNYDLDEVGYEDEGTHIFDTTRPGNSNAGHDDYRENPADPPHTFSEDERKALISFIKSL